MTLPFDVPEQSAVAALSAAVSVQDSLLAEAKVRLEEARERRAALADRMSAHAASRPSEEQRVDDAMLDALAADPTTAIDAEAMMEGVRATMAEHRLWGAQNTVLARSLAKVEEEIAILEKAHGEQRARRGDTWARFVDAAYGLLVGRFCEAIDIVQAEIVDPMTALAAELRDNGTPIVTALKARMDVLSHLKIDYHVPRQSQVTDWESEGWEEYHAEVARVRALGGDFERVVKPEVRPVTRAVTSQELQTLQLYPRPRGQAPIGSIATFRASLGAAPAAPD